jgi:hypothetical protein
MKNKQTIRVETNLTIKNMEKFVFKLENEILSLTSFNDYKKEDSNKINSNPKINFDPRVFNND